METLKTRWRDVVIVALVLSNILLVNYCFAIKREVASLEYHVTSNKSDLHTLKLVCDMLERKINNLTADVEEVQEANKYKPFW